MALDPNRYRPLGNFEDAARNERYEVYVDLTKAITDGVIEIYNSETNAFIEQLTFDEFDQIERPSNIVQKYVDKLIEYETSMKV